MRRSIVALVTVLCALAAHAQTGALYHFDEGSGTTAIDSSGNAKNATISGAMYVSGHSGTALHFRGNSNDTVNVPLLFSQPLLTSYFEAWVRPASWGSYYIFLDNTGTGLSTDWSIGTSSTGSVTCHFGDTGTVSGGQLPINTWSNVRCQYDGATLRLQINGTTIASRTATFSGFTWASHAEIGNNAANVGNSSGRSIAFDGDIDEVRISTTATAPCTYAIQPSTATVSANASSYAAQVSTGSTCAWTATSSATWLGVTPTNGTGTSTITYTTTANLSTAPRIATITVNGATLSVTQSAISCAYTVSPQVINAPAAGTTGSISVSTVNGCPWTASSASSWFTLNAFSGTGTGSIGYTVAPNTTSAVRSGTANVAGTAVTISQAGTPTSASVPILFVNGFCGSSSGWNPMIANLTSIDPQDFAGPVATLYFNGASVSSSAKPGLMPPRLYTIEFHNTAYTGADQTLKVNVNKIPIEMLAYQLKRVIDYITSNTGASSVDIVAHSMGGLVVRAYLEGVALSSDGVSAPYAGNNVRRVVTLDTPHSGVNVTSWTNLASFLPFDTVQCMADPSSTQRIQMTPGNNFLDGTGTQLGLNKSDIPKGVLLTSVAARAKTASDDGVIPYTSQAITTINQYNCVNTIDTQPDILNLDPVSATRLHIDITDRPDTAVTVINRLTSSPVRTACQALVPGTPTRFDVPALQTLGHVIWVAITWISAFDKTNALSACNVDVIARSSSGAELARKTVSTSDDQVVNLGVINDSDWHVELSTTCPVSASVTIGDAPAPVPSGCSADTTTLCLNNSRFRVQVNWKTSEGNTGLGQATQLTTDTGHFWFFNNTNVELMVKVLDGRGINGHFWVFYGALTNVQYTITVTDTQTGQVKTYFNAQGVMASNADVSAF